MRLFQIASITQTNAGRVEVCHNIVLASLLSVLTENAALSCSLARVHITTPTRSILEAPVLWIPPYYGHTAVVPTVSILEGLHCMPTQFP